MDTDALSQRQREDWVDFHARWLRTWQRYRRVDLWLVIFNVAIGVAAITWASFHLPALWWLYAFALPPAAAIFFLMRTMIRLSRRIQGERSALDSLASRPQSSVERRTFAPGNYDAERERAIRDTFLRGRIIVGRVREGGESDLQSATDTDSEAEA